MSLAAMAIDRRAKPVTLIRNLPGAFVGGRWEGGEPAETQIRAVIQPPGAADLRMMPEGEWVEGDVIIWTRAELLTADEATRTNADLIRTSTGSTYKIIRVADRADGGFFRATARLSNDRGRTV